MHIERSLEKGKRKWIILKNDGKHVIRYEPRNKVEQ